VKFTLSPTCHFLLDAKLANEVLSSNPPPRLRAAFDESSKVTRVLMPFCSMKPPESTLATYDPANMMQVAGQFLVSCHISLHNVGVVQTLKSHVSIPVPRLFRGRDSHVPSVVGLRKSCDQAPFWRHPETWMLSELSSNQSATSLYPLAPVKDRKVIHLMSSES
jgi:hypothetical protein